MATFDAFRFVELIAPRPLLMIVGREAVISWMGLEAFQSAAGRRNCTGSTALATWTSTTWSPTSPTPSPNSPTSSPLVWP